MIELTRTATTILIIDDEPSSLDDVADALRPSDYNLQMAASPQAAIECVRRAAPDLIISDIDLGGTSGLDLAQELRYGEGIGDVSVIFLSGAQIPDVVKRSRSAGGVYFLRKPFDPEVLVELVDKALWMPHLLRRRLQGCAGISG
ncbi:MAG TPA: response regulator [Pirellulales bacterium]|jgi:CheY-like chemotaxis protein|nr:response regulator [Pirellulales bacterium]